MRLANQISIEISGAKILFCDLPKIILWIGMGLDLMS